MDLWIWVKIVGDAIFSPSFTDMKFLKILYYQNYVNWWNGVKIELQDLNQRSKQTDRGVKLNKIV